MGKHHPISGAKGGSESAKSPTETPDSLISIAYAKVLDGISEGPIVGLVNGNQSIFLDKTPLANADGSLNFSNVTVATRTGEADQDYVPGFPSVESETAVGVELKASQAWVQSISNLELSAVRVRLQVPYLSSTDSKGNINGYEVKYAIDVATDSGAYVEVLASSFNGKTTTTYERSHRVELPAAKSGWRVRVRRLTADSTSSSIQSRTSIASYTEIIDAKLRYPYSAVVGITVDASQFSSIPARAFDVKLRIVRVPSNYSPENRTYAGTWDGTFKLAWTDNPAWIYYDLLLNDRYGLGALITAAQVDRWGLYQIARYCDEMVDDGKGGTEPRFACNVYLQTRAEALQVLQDLASVFRGMAYWAAGSVMAVADMPSDPVYTYNQANVIDGAFTYAGSAKSTRFTVALVSWNDPANFYEKKVEYVSDQKGLARYGVQQTELTAFGCTSQGQAQRLGHYTLLTNRLENETVSFAVGLDGTIARPGQIIRVADEARAGRRIGGRISASTATTVTLDSDATVAAGDTLVVILPTGVAETRTVKAYAARVVTVTQAFTTAPVAQSVFAIETTTLVPQAFRVLSVAEDFGQSDLRYTITAVKHVAGKYAAIDSGAQIVTLPVTVIPSSVQAPPTNIQLSSYDSVDQGISISTLRATWVAPDNAVSYDVWWRRDSNDWTYAGRCYTSSMEVRGVYAGTYLVRVAAINALDAASTWAYSQPTPLAGKIGKPPALAQLKTTPGPWKITLDWAFPAEGAGDTAYTEIQQAFTAQGDNAQSMGLFAYPTNTYTLTGLAAGARLFFRGRLIDRIGNVGPWTTWTVGTASADATEYNKLITEQFVKSALGEQLFKRIDLIDADATVVNSVAYRVAQEAKARADADTSEANARVNADKVNADAITAETNARAAAVLQESKDRAAAVLQEANDRKAAVTSEATARQNADTSLGQRIDTVTASTGSNATAIQTEIKARTDADTALGSRIDTVAATSNGNTSAIQTEAKTRADADTALGTRVDTVSAATGNNATAIQTEVKARTDADTALGSRIDTVAATTNGNTTAISNEVKARTDADSALGSRIDSLSTTVGNNTTAITSETKARTDADTALGQRVDTVSTTVAGKADSSTVQTLQNQVTAQGNTITSQGTSITSINAALTNAGGENLLYNPSFDTAKASDATLPAGWSVSYRTTTGTNALVSSTFKPTGKSVRIDVSAFTDTGSYADLTPDGGFRPPAVEGQIVTLSASFKATAGLMTQLFFQFRDSTGAVLRTDGATSTVATGAAQRVKLTSAAAPANSVVAGVILRIRMQTSSSPTAGYVEWDDAQVEIGSIMTGWSDNGQVAAGGIAANAAALTAVTARVTSAEGTVTSQGSAITNLQNGLSTTNGNVTAVQNSVSALQNTVTSQGNSITAQGNQITTINSNLSTAGGENLLYNPSFETAGTAGMADGYSRGNSSSEMTSSASLVDSILRPGTKAQRFDQANTSGTRYCELLSYRSNTATDLQNAPASAGQILTESIYVMGTEGSNLVLRLLAYDAAGALLSTTTAPTVALSEAAFKRISVTSAALPTGTATVRLSARHYGTAGSTSAFAIFDQAQVELGAVATGWRDNGKTAAAATAANATATSALGTRVTNAEGAITSQGNSITLINSSLGAVGGENLLYNPSFDAANASNAALAAGWASSVSSGATGTPSQVASTLDPAGKAQRYDVSSFTSSTVADWNSNRFSASEGQTFSLSVYARGTVGLGAQLTVQFRNASGTLLSEVNSQNLALSEAWSRISVSTPAGAPSGATQVQVRLRTRQGPSNPVAAGFTEFDRAQLEQGLVVTGWRDSSGVLAAQQTGTASAVSSLTTRVTSAEGSIGSQSNALSQLSTRVGSAETAIQSEQSARSSADEALGKRVDTTQASLGNTNASVQQISQAQAATDGKVNANWAVKLGVTQDGTYYMAGIGVGIEAGGGNVGLQSSVAVAADRFLVLGPGIDGKGKSFFSVVNGQTFIDTAFIDKAYINSALIGQTIVSQAYTQFNEPIMSADFGNGQLTCRHLSKKNTYAFMNRDGVVVVVDGVLRVRMGVW